VQIQANDPQIIAPYGLNCSLCRAYIRERNPCPGCRGSEINKSNACLACAIKNCEKLAAGGYQFCSSCDKFPCAALLHLDARYKDKYGVSAIGNLQHIKAVGAKRFVAEETARWTCSECGSLFACTSRSASIAATRGNAYSQRGADTTPNPSIERTCPGKPGHASHVKPMQFNMASHPYR
jgi:hypothetical protein